MDFFLLNGYGRLYSLRELIRVCDWAWGRLGDAEAAVEETVHGLDWWTQGLLGRLRNSKQAGVFVKLFHNNFVDFFSQHDYFILIKETLLWRDLHLRWLRSVCILIVSDRATTNGEQQHWGASGSVHWRWTRSTCWWHWLNTEWSGPHLHSTGLHKVS